uniref:Reverse transcriptase domain-containing protein n=1 Tax=Triticum urartu TaxID=4572 RepID=A0A8R7TKR7_TRIUA
MEILEKRNFGPRWRKWIYQITHLGSVGVKINGLEGSFFTTGKGPRQGDTISPLLFNLVVDILSKMLAKAVANDLIKGLCSDLVPSGVVCLQYAYDTILFVDKDED